MIYKIDVIYLFLLTQSRTIKTVFSYLPIKEVFVWLYMYI